MVRGGSGEYTGRCRQRFAARNAQSCHAGMVDRGRWIACVLGLYSAAAKHIAEPGLEINLLFRKVRDDVLARTNRQQEPFTYGSLPAQQFFFKR
jgi:hypothetical protein